MINWTLFGSIYGIGEKSNCLLFILYNLQGEKRVRKDIKYYFFCNAEIFKFFILEMATQFLVKAL